MWLQRHEQSRRHCLLPPQTWCAVEIANSVPYWPLAACSMAERAKTSRGPLLLPVTPLISERGRRSSPLARGERQREVSPVAGGKSGSAGGSSLPARPDASNYAPTGSWDSLLWGSCPGCAVADAETSPARSSASVGTLFRGSFCCTGFLPRATSLEAPVSVTCARKESSVSASRSSSR